MKNHQQIVSEWLKQIGNTKNLLLQLDEDGHCVVSAENGMHGVIEVPAVMDVPAVFIYLPLISLSDNPATQSALTRAALEMNLFGLLTGGCQIALDNRSNYVVLSYSVMIDAIDGALFQRVLIDMLEAAPRLQQRLQNIVTPTTLSTDQLILSQHCFTKRTSVLKSPLKLTN